MFCCIQHCCEKRKYLWPHAFCWLLDKLLCLILKLETALESIGIFILICLFWVEFPLNSKSNLLHHLSPLPSSPPLLSSPLLSPHLSSFTHLTFFITSPSSSPHLLFLSSPPLPSSPRLYLPWFFLSHSISPNLFLLFLVLVSWAVEPWHSTYRTLMLYL